MGIWKRLFGSSRASRAALDSTRGTVSPEYSVMTYQLGGTSTRSARGMLEAYSKVPKLRSVAARLSRSVGATEWKLYRTGTARSGLRLCRDLQAIELAGWDRRTVLNRALAAGEVVPVTSHPIVDVLDRPNPYMTGIDFFGVSQLHLDLTGNAFWVLMRNDLGEIGELWPLPRDWVQRLPIATDPRFHVRWVDQSLRAINMEDMIWIRDIDPANPYSWGVGELATLATELDTDEEAAKTVAYRFRNRGMPDHVIVAEGAKKAELEAAKAEWMAEHGGAQGSGSVHFTGRKVQIEKLSEALVDMDIVRLRSEIADLVRETPGVPPEIMGIIENSNRATITAAQYLYAINALVPRLWKFESAMNAALIPDGFVLLFESPIPSDLDGRLQRMSALPEAGTLDEWRTLQGLPEIGGRFGSMHVVDGALVTLEQFAANALSPNRISDPSVTLEAVQGGLVSRSSVG